MTVHVALLALRLTAGLAVGAIGVRTLVTGGHDRRRLASGAAQSLGGACLALGLWPIGAAIVAATGLLGLASPARRRELWRSARRSVPATFLVVAVVVSVAGPGRLAGRRVADEPIGIRPTTASFLPTPALPERLVPEPTVAPAATAAPEPEQATTAPAPSRSGPPPEDGTDSPEQVPHAPQTVLVGIENGERERARASVRARGGRVIDATPGFLLVETPRPVEEWLREPGPTAGIAYAEPDYVVTVDQVTPRDPGWAQLWGMQRIGMPAAWERTRGSRDVIVGVIDTGIDHTHPDIGGDQMWANPGETPANGIDDDRNGWVDDVHGADCVNGDGDPMDDNDHGTHVAGTIAAATDNGVGVAGVGWNVRLMALKFLGPDGSGTVSDAVQCIDYAVRMGAMLTNNSWGGAGYSMALRDAIGRAAAAGQLFVAAAGNDGVNIDDVPSYPASYDLENIVSVAASRSDDGLAPFSNVGATSVDLAAPGMGIVSTVPGGYARFDGTSMAAPHVAGVAALLLSLEPGLSPGDLHTRIVGSVDPIPGMAGKVASGGRLNAPRALDAVTAAPTPVPPPSPTPAAVSIEPVSRVRIQRGRAVGDPVRRLAEDDGRAFRVASRGRRRHVVAWVGTARIDPAGAREVRLIFDGSTTRRVRQRLFVFDVRAGGWTRIAKGRLARAERTLAWASDDPGRFVAPDGSVRVRLRAVRAGRFVSRTDLLRLVAVR